MWVDRSRGAWEDTSLPPLERYLVSCRHGGHAETTIYGRRRAIIRFVLQTGLDPIETTPDQMVGWWTSLKLTASSRVVVLNLCYPVADWSPDEIRHPGEVAAAHQGSSAA